MSKRFILVGASGYIAQRHIKAIHDVGGDLVAVYDPNPSCGIMDRYFDNVRYFDDLFFFQKWITSNEFDYFVICTPNYTHFSYIIMGMSVCKNIICEKPLVIDSKDIDFLLKYKYGDYKIYPILQARIHPEIVKLKAKIDKQLKKNRSRRYKVDCLYMSKRSEWYDKSWKGNPEKSGGVLMNIGIHLFDVLFYLFGPGGEVTFDTSIKHERWCSGVLKLHKADCKFHVSINKKDLPEGKNVIRQIEVDGEKIEFSKGFADLHLDIYKRILDGTWNIDLNELKEPIALCGLRWGGV